MDPGVTAPGKGVCSSSQEEGATLGHVGKHQAPREAEGAGGRCGQEALLWFPQEGMRGKQALDWPV